jgi:hypothetical protein
LAALIQRLPELAFMAGSILSFLAATTQIRLMTGGRGYFTMEFDRYKTVPQHLAAAIVDARKKEMEAKKEE